MRYFWLPLVLLFLLGTACAEPKLVVVRIDVDDTAAMEGALRWRVQPTTALAVQLDPCGLWTDVALPPTEIAILGDDAEPGPWRVPANYLAGDLPGRDGRRLDDATMRRLARFLNHTREHSAVKAAEPSLRRRVLAAHTARALATEIIARDRAQALFVRLDARSPDLPYYCADTVRDLLALAGPTGGGLVFLRDERQGRLLVFTDRRVTISNNPTRTQVAALMKQILKR